jgi:hypothetical protein
MNLNHWKARILSGLVTFFMLTVTQAASPVWTFTPLTATTITVPANGTATISYTVTNQSTKPHTLVMTPIAGISPSGTCSAPLGPKKSCTLTLKITANALHGNVVGGPVLCQRPSKLQCYQPSQANSLNITLNSAKYFTITPSTDGNGVISPNTAQTVGINGSLSFRATPNAEFRIYQWVLDGVVVQEGGVNYTLSNITANHTVEATFTSIFATIDVLPDTLDIQTGGFAGSVSVTNLSPSVTANFSAPVIANPAVATLSLSSTCTGTLAPESSCTYVFTSTGLAGTNTTATITPNPLTTKPTSIPITIMITATPPVILSQSVTQLALSVKNTAKNSALTGNPRQITITNTDPTNTAVNVDYVSTDLPFGTTITPATCGDILAGGTCVITIHPGANASADPYDLTPTPITLNIQGENTSALTAEVTILDFGSVYQSGFVFAINDSYAAYPIGVSVGGTTASLVDQAPPRPNGIIWSSDGNPGVVDYFDIPGIYETSTNPPDACDGAYDGFCNTGQIVAHYSGVPLTYYAAGLCTDYSIDSLGNSPCAAGTCYNQWYLPAICEMGPSDPNFNYCAQGTSNMVDNLSVLIDADCSIGGGTSCLRDINWSSTERAVDPSTGVFAQIFFPNNRTHVGGRKEFKFAVRCTRALTQ